MRARYLVPLLALLAGASPAFASSTSPGSIRDMSTWGNGFASFNHTGLRYDTVACQNSGDPKSWAINTTTAAGQAVYAMLLSAYAQGKQVGIVGTGTCDVRPNVETVLYILFVD